MQTPSNERNGRLLIYAPVPLFQHKGILYFEDQAANGQLRWAENFDGLISMLPLRYGPPPPSWVPLEEALADMRSKIQIEPLPTAYRPDQFLRKRSEVKKKLRMLIQQADFLSFAIGGLWGDWGAEACGEAHKLGRRYAVWTDRVESQVVKESIGQGTWRQSLKARLYHRPMFWQERRAIERSSLGLFHGKETYDAYAPFSRNPHIVHDIHISKDEHISKHALASKLQSCTEGPLKICYVGRMDGMKGPHDWLAVLEQLTEKGIAFQATWVGTGTEEVAMRARLAGTPLGDRVDLPGFVSDREQILDHIRDAHIMLFCHKTPESPRCLIEALISGTPIVGYDGAYAQDLISENGGGVLTPIHDVEALTDAVAQLASDRGMLQNLITQAVQDGSAFDDVSVFKHRSDLIKGNL